ncbi:hypothetical protein C6503_18560, partial [Candidatus Poribacteria bacterium]
MQSSWIFRIVERIKHIKVQSPTTRIPIELSEAAGHIVVLLTLIVLGGLLFPFGRLIGSALAAETQIAKTE